MKYSKATSISIKGDYCKGIDMDPKEKFMSSNSVHFPAYQKRSESNKVKLGTKSDNVTSSKDKM